MAIDDHDGVESFVDDNREMLERVLRHSDDAYARACAWTLLDIGSDDPDLEQLQAELDALQEAGA